VTQPGRSGFEAKTREPERRALFDIVRRLTALDGGGSTPNQGLADEVFIGNTQPPAPENYELWYDPDATGTSVGTLQFDSDPLVYPGSPITTTAVQICSLDLGVQTYRRIAFVYIQTLVTIDVAASYGTLGVGLSGNTTRRIRMRQSAGPCSFVGMCFGNIAPGAACVGFGEFNTQASGGALVTMAGSTDFNRIDFVTIGVP
jgi:hypothetical protein